ncbi:kinase-like protein [Delitschia confertaspora ATCC 74209]|uniref:non-specific serine/threonine protein kinase n=1 Tax=Delitschia confertaspora ATCC 74209 TaxID=1513339 RepID=A0A9P4JN40_9PLEO|nr:kinase-like protein [Delitschia confertaspora ATCC 74209]
MASTEKEQLQQTVRFSSVNQEIEPEISLQDVQSPIGVGEDRAEQLSPAAEEEIRNLSMNIQKSRCQARRLENFSFEPMSLPASRAPSPSSATRVSSNHSSIYSKNTSRPSPPTPSMHSPPLTPAGTFTHESKAVPVTEHRKSPLDAAMMTPQISPPHEPPPTSMDGVHGERKSDSPANPRSSRRSPAESRRPSTSLSDVTGAVQAHPRHPPTFTVGPAGDSVPPSRDVSPSGSPGMRTPGHYSSGTSTPSYSRPFTPSEEKDNPYARSKRPPQPRNLDGLDARFIFGHRDRRRENHSASQLPRSKGNETPKEEKKHGFFGSGKHQYQNSTDDSDGHGKAELGKQHQHGSMSELKRFFRLGGHKHHKEKRAQSPVPVPKPSKTYKSQKAGTMTPPVSHASSGIPFADDHGLQSRYGKFGKVLGSGAGGSVRLMKRSSDGTTFAVKQFRARHSYESEKEYNKKVTAEFCIGSTLHHGNIIETMDLVHERGNYYVVMEYAPYDLFAIVMTGNMSREEISCATLQILNGVTYLHSMGLAHRDLKLDNVVVNEHGIMKIIDFGSAAVFRYPFENEIVPASGIVGSDPYLAPEVYDLAKYDPQPTDIWSLAIIFCCMTLRRFPWKAPRISDNSYKLFVSPPNMDPTPSSNSSRSITELAVEGANEERHQNGSYSAPASRHTSNQSSAAPPQQRKDPVTNDNRPSGQSAAVAQQAKPQPEIVKGPWRLLRLLPRETRHIIGRMLEIDPKKRATMEEILDDKWVKFAQVCSQEEGGTILRAEGHTHTLEPGSGGSPAPTGGQK